MDLRQLEYFLKVAERRSITAAAADLSVTQPTLTKSIRLLEQELGVALFERLPRGVELTDYGRSLLRHAQAIRIQVHDALGELDGLRGGAAGMVAIGAGPAWLRRHLPRAVGRAIASRPALRVRIDGGFDEALLRALRRGSLDFVVAELPLPGSARDLETIPLASDDLGVCCRAGHPLAGRGALPARDLLAFPWVMPPRATRTWRRLEALFVAADLTPPECTVETESMAFVLAMLRESDALTYTVRTTLQLPEGEGVVMLDAPALTAIRRAGVIKRRNSRFSPAAEAIVAELQAICRENPQN